METKFLPDASNIIKNYLDWFEVNGRKWIFPLCPNTPIKINFFQTQVKIWIFRICHDGRFQSDRWIHKPADAIYYWRPAQKLIADNSWHTMIFNADLQFDVNYVDFWKMYEYGWYKNRDRILTWIKQIEDWKNGNGK